MEGKQEDYLWAFCAGHQGADILLKTLQYVEALIFLLFVSEIAEEDLSAGTVLVTEAELSSCVEDVFKVECVI